MTLKISTSLRTFFLPIHRFYKGGKQELMVGKMDKKHLMKLSRLRQLGPQQFTKTAKAEKGQAFFNYLSVFFFLEKKQKYLT